MVNKALLTTTILVSTVPALSETSGYTSGEASEISMVLNENTYLNGDTLGLVEAEMKLEIKKQVNTLLKSVKLGNDEKKLLKFYGTDVFVDKIYEIIDSILSSPDKYGVFDSEGNLSIYDKNGELVNEDEIILLFKRIFLEYELNNSYEEGFSHGTWRTGIFEIIMAIVVGMILRKRYAKNEK